MPHCLMPLRWNATLPDGSQGPCIIIHPYEHLWCPIELTKKIKGSLRYLDQTDREYQNMFPLSTSSSPERRYSDDSVSQESSKWTKRYSFCFVSFARGRGRRRRRKAQEGKKKIVDAQQWATRKPYFHSDWKPYSAGWTFQTKNIQPVAVVTSLKLFKLQFGFVQKSQKCFIYFSIVYSSI